MRDERTEEELQQAYSVLATQLGDVETKLYFLNVKKIEILKGIDKLNTALLDKKKANENKSEQIGRASCRERV